MKYPSLFFTFSLSLLTSALAFAPSNTNAIRRTAGTELYADATAEEVTIDPKEAVKVFGRLAEKYIMLDSSGGMCCYSACSGKFSIDYRFYFVYYNSRNIAILISLQIIISHITTTCYDTIPIN